MEEEDIENIKLYRFVGYIVIISTILGIFGMGAAWIYSHHRRVAQIHLEFPYIGALNLDDPFIINGYQVGMVRGINVIAPNRVILGINLHYHITVNEGFELFVAERGILGGSVVKMINSNIHAPLVSLSDTLSGEYLLGVPDLLGKIMLLRQFLDDAANFVNTLKHGDNDALSIVEWLDNTQTSIDRIVGGLQNFSLAAESDLPQTIADIHNLVTTLNTELTNFDEIVPDIIERTGIIIEEADNLVERIAQIQTVSSDIQNIVDFFDESLDLDSISLALIGLQREITAITDEALRLRLLLNLGRF